MYDKLHASASPAGFYFLGIATNVGKAEKLEAVVAKQQAGKKLSKLESKIYASYKDRVDKQGDQKYRDLVMRRVRDLNTMTPEQFIREDAYSSSEASYLSSPGRTGQTVIPTLTDSDVLMLLEDTDLATKAAVPEITSTRREGGGYLVQRGVFINGKRQQLAE